MINNVPINNIEVMPVVMYSETLGKPLMGMSSTPTTGINPVNNFIKLWNYIPDEFKTTLNT